jgi:beta-galactosidase
MKPIKHMTLLILTMNGMFIMASCGHGLDQKTSLEEAVHKPRTEILFDAGWKFHRGDAEGAEAALYNDTEWRKVDLPHDWSIEDIPGTDSPNDPDAPGGISMGYFVNGTGWYRKSFLVPARLEGKRFHLRFDGIYMNADVWLNGEHLGNHPYGYTSFLYDITSLVSCGEQNTLAIKVRNEGRNSRWYSGSGIYRHVWLSILNPVCVGPWGTFVTVPSVTGNGATVMIENTLVNEEDDSQDIQVITEIRDAQGTTVAAVQDNHTLQPGGSKKITQEVVLESPDLWSPETPVLYEAFTEILGETSRDKATVLDRSSTGFGIRTFSFNAASGFELNGVPLLLKGGCVHHDNGPLGSAAFDRAEERRVELLRASGFNAIRCAHNPPSPAFLDACDRLGMLVIDEAFDQWRRKKNPQDYHLYFDEWWKKDLGSMVLRDRNHPCIIMWSTGNEIPERGDPEGAETAQMLAEYVRSLDPTRPVTAAVNGVGPDKDPYFSSLDVCGYNYALSQYEESRETYPERIIYASESFPLEAFEYWMGVLDHPNVIGDFVWTSFDYLGEASIGWMGYPHDISFYPWTHAFCGDIDICGFKRPQSHYRDALWDNGDKISIFVVPPEPSFGVTNPDKKEWSKWDWQDVVDDWTWTGHEGEEFEIEVYAPAGEVELWLNDESLGRKPSGRETKYTTRWKVPYQPGSLRAVLTREGQEIASDELKTAGEVDRIHLTADRSNIRADGQDLSFITVELLDDAGTVNPKAANLLNFQIDGPGSIQAVGSSNPMSTESYTGSSRKAYRGRCLVVVRSGDQPGEIRLTATAEGLQPSEFVVQATGSKE